MQKITHEGDIISSTTEQIDDAVAKRHVQNTDTAAGAQSADLDMNLHKIIGLADPTGDKDGANKEYVDTHGGGGGSGDVVGPGSAVNNALSLFDGTTGKLIKDSVRLVEDTLSDGDNLPDGHAIKVYGDANWSAGSGDVVGPASAADNALPLFDGVTGKLIKDSTRLVEDVLSDGSNLPDGHAIKIYGDTNWNSGGYTNLTEFITQTAFRVFYSDIDGDVTELALGADGTYLKSNGPAANPSFGVPGGGGDVIGPGSAVANALPLFDGTTGKLIKDSTRLVEDTMTDGSNLPDGHAVKTYGDTNWGGGSSKWTDAGTYIRPNAGAGYCVLDAGTDLTAITFAADTTYVLAPGATYDIGSSVIISNNRVAIIGNGATIKKIAQADGIRITGNYCTVGGATINGNAQGWSGIFITGSNNTIDGVVSHNNGGLGIGQDGQSTTCQHNKIVNCTAYSNGEIGISMNVADFSIVSNNTSYSNTLEGFTCDANSPNWASGCTFDGNVAFDNRGGVGQFGIDRARNCVFSNNIVDGYAGLDGMKTQNNQGPVEFCVFTGNLLVNNGGYGINITSGTGGASNHNKLVGNIYRNNTSGDYSVISGQNNVIIESDSGLSKWTDAGTYYHPNNWSYLRIQDSNVMEIADSASFTDGFPWDDTVPYPGSTKGSMLNIGQTSSSDGNPPLWVQKKFNKSGAGNDHHAGAGHFEVWKQSGSTGSAVSALTGCIQQEAASGDAIGIHGRARKHGEGNVYAGWYYAYRPSGQTGGYCHGLEINVSNRAQNTGFADTVGVSADIGLWIYPQDSTYPSLTAIGIGADSSANSHWNGILFNTNAVRENDSVGINMAAVHPQYGLKFTEVQDSHIYCSSGNLVFRDTITGQKTLAELAAAGGGGLNNIVEDLTPQLGGYLDLNEQMIMGNGIIGLNNTYGYYCKNTSGDYRKGVCLNSNNDWEFGLDAHMLAFGYGCSDANPVMIRVGGVNNKQILVGGADSGGSGYRMLRVTN